MVALASWNNPVLYLDRIILVADRNKKNVYGKWMGNCTQTATSVFEVRSACVFITDIYG